VTDVPIRELAGAIAAAARRLHARGLLAGAEGNISVRLGDDDLLVTPSGADKATLEGADILRVRFDGSLRHDALPTGSGSDGVRSDSGRRASSELGMHVTCYRARPDVRAVVHAHPPAATGFAAAGIAMPDDVLPELPVVVGPVALVPYGRPGTAALGAALAPLLHGHEAFLLANHGVATVGRSLGDALLRMESVEQAARILLAARLLGGAVSLGREEAVALRALWAGREVLPERS
jgi:L-fuculose-phosphate aldolase